MPMLLLDPTLRIRGVNSAYERATLRPRDELVGELLFEAFPDNPDDPEACGTHNLGASLETVMRTGRSHDMWVQRYDVADPAQSGKFVPKVWGPRNSPVYDHGELVGIVHQVEELTDLQSTLSAMAHALEADDTLSPAEQLHVLAVFAAALPAERERLRALSAENEQLRQAVETRDIIGQAKGMVMERYGLSADAAFRLLVRLSQQSNTRVVEIARRLVEIDQPRDTAL